MAITNASTLAEYAAGISTQGATLTVDANNKRVGIGTTNPQAMLQVGTGVTVFGNAGIASFTSLKLSGGTDSTSTTTGALTVTGGVGIGLSLTVGGSVSIGGTLTYEDVTNIDSVGLITARSGLEIGLAGVGGTVSGVGIITAPYIKTGGTDVSVGLGARVLASNTTGVRNVAVGADALNTNTTGSSNVAVGDYAGKDLDGGSRNIAVGAYAGTSDQNGTTLSLIHI